MLEVELLNSKRLSKRRIFLTLKLLKFFGKVKGIPKYWYYSVSISIELRFLFDAVRILIP